jgi:cytochrome c oxidase subunit 2
MMAVLAGATALSGAALANLPKDGGIWLVPPASKIAEEQHFFHDVILTPVIIGISLFVLALLVWIIVRYNSKANPNASKFSHSTLLELVWTIIPIFILLYIALFSFDLLYKEEIIPDGKRITVVGDGSTTAFVVANDFPASRQIARPEHLQVFVSSPAGERRLERGADYKLAGLGKPQVTITLEEALAVGERLVINAGRSLVGPGLFSDRNKEIALAPTMTLKVIGNQWNWRYAYPDYGDFDFIANMLPAEKTTPELFRFEVDNRVVIPVGETIRVTTTAADVIHAWALPNFGIKVDAIPGRFNEVWFKADREGVFYGQCSEICGVKHSAMPIAVEVVSRDAFCSWVAARQAEAATVRTDEQRRAEPLCGVGLPPVTPTVTAAAAAPTSDATSALDASAAAGAAAAAAAPAAAVAEPAPVIEAAPDAGKTAAPSAEVVAEIRRCQDDIDALLAGKTIEFASSRSVIEDVSKPLLDSLAAATSGCDSVVINIAGHTDASGNAEKNVALSAARAEAVRAYLVGKGVAADRLAAEGFGASKPVADNGTPEGRSKNRRIEFTVAAAAAEPANE